MTRPPIADTNATTGLVGLGPIPGEAPVASFNLDQIESLLRTKGFIAYHYKSALNPDRTSVELGANVNTKAAHYGLIYYEVRQLLVVPQRITLNQTLQLQGNFDSAAVTSLNVTGNYTDGDQSPVYLKPRDIIVLNPTITVLAEQLIEYNPNGPLKLKYRVKGVDLLMSKDVRFKEGLDFEVRSDGLIYWLGGRRPKFHNGKGDVLSINYWISPHYVVNSSPHTLRVIPSNEQGHGGQPRHAKYAPQQVIVAQSHLVENDLADFFNLPEYVAPNDGPNTHRG